MKIKSMPRFILSLIILFVIISCFTNMFINKVFSHEKEEFNNITVCQGDTLWSIASKLEGNINENVYEIKKLNKLDSSIVYVGQESIVPVNKI